MVRGLAVLAAGLIWVHAAAAAEPSPVAVRIAALDAKSCVSEPELRAALAQAGIAAPPAGAEPNALQLEIAGTPEHLSVQIRGLGNATTTLMAPATCATATDVVRAFLVSTLAPVPAVPPVPPVPPVPASVAPEPKLEARTLFDAVRAELARRGLQLVLEGVTLAIERDQSGTWFARVARVDMPVAQRTIALGNFDDPSEPRIANVVDLIAPAIAQLSSHRYRQSQRQAAIQRALQRVDGFPSDAGAGAAEITIGGAFMAVLIAGHAPNVHFAFDTAENAFFSSSASVAVLGGSASFLVSDDYRRTVIGVTSLASEAEDLVQEVFLVVHRRLPEYRREARLTTWLFRIAYRVAGAHVRRERFRRRLLSMFGIEARTIESPAHAAHDGAQAEQVRAALAQLSFAKSSVLVLYEVEGWSCQEIADLLAVPLGTVHTRLHHARRDFARACQHTIARSRT